jgi:hypothetical protein
MNDISCGDEETIINQGGQCYLMRFIWGMFLKVGICALTDGE